jgi:hypothetical protein
VLGSAAAQAVLLSPYVPSSLHRRAGKGISNGLRHLPADHLTNGADLPSCRELNLCTVQLDVQTFQMIQVLRVILDYSKMHDDHRIDDAAGKALSPR